LLPVSPEIFFMPLAVPQLHGFGELDSGVLSRRLPHFLQLLLSQQGAPPTSMLEVQSPPGDGQQHWVTLREPLDAAEALQLVPAEAGVWALVTGVLRCRGRQLEIDLELHLAGSTESHPTDVTARLRALLEIDDPAPGMVRLARGLARQLRTSLAANGLGPLTRRGEAFFAFLDGLDGAALLASDIPSEVRPEELVAPFGRALVLDPSFGSALRMAQMTIATALEDESIDSVACNHVFDTCFAARPRDGDACLAVAEQMTTLGEAGRARAWLEHAAQLEPPPARALESLGILQANDGDTISARQLWLRGLEIDGHPDFFAHLARTSFSDGIVVDGWDKMLRGLRRIFERAARPGEWHDDGRGQGILLRYLVEHVSDSGSPAEIVEALCDLAGMFAEGEDRIDLGLCLHAVGQMQLAAAELQAGLAEELSIELRDRALRVLLEIDVPDFDRRFTAAVDEVVTGGDPGRGAEVLEGFLEIQSDFWPAMFFVAVAERRLGNQDGALDLMAEVLRLHPGQPDALVAMAELFDERGNPKRALECVEEALEGRADDAEMLAARSRYLRRLGRP